MAQVPPSGPVLRKRVSSWLLAAVAALLLSTAGKVQGCGKAYSVALGDTCHSIRRAQGISTHQLHDLNPQLDDACDLQAGQVLCVQADGTPAVAPSLFPAQALDLSNFMLHTQHAGSAAMFIAQPQLATYVDPAHFFVTYPGGVSGGGASPAVAFVTSAGGATTSGSDYPRTELREMMGGGSAPAAWDLGGSVMHNLTLTGSTQRLTPGRPQVVIAQILSPNGQPMQVRVVGSSTANGSFDIRLTPNGKKVAVLDPSYSLGSTYTIRLSAGQGRIDVYYQDLSVPAFTLAVTNLAGCYFKAGNYLQSNTMFDSADASSEVWLTALRVTQG